MCSHLLRMCGDTQEVYPDGLAMERVVSPLSCCYAGQQCILPSQKSMACADESLTFHETSKWEDVHSIKVQARAMGNPRNWADLLVLFVWLIQKLLSKGCWPAHKSLACLGGNREEYWLAIWTRVLCHIKAAKISMRTQAFVVQENWKQIINLPLTVWP